MMMPKRKKTKENKNPSMSVEFTGLILILIGAIGLGFGIIGALIKKFAMFLAGTWWLIILLSIIILGFYMLFKRKMPKFNNPRLIGLYLIFIVLLTASHLEFLNKNQKPQEIISATYANYMERMSSIPDNAAIDTDGTSSIVIGGGFIGAISLFVLASLFDKVGTIIILVLLSILSVILCFDIILSELLQKIIGLFKRSKEKEMVPKENLPNNDDEVVISDAANNLISPKDEGQNENDKIIITSIDSVKQKSNEVVAPSPVKEEKEEFPNDGSYVLPRIEKIFDPVKAKKINSTDFTRSNKEILERVLADFGIQARVVEIHIGPAVTQYELTVPNGTKVSKIVSINKEIALALAAKDVIIQAPIPGKNTIGVEIPNPTIASVSLREVLESNENQHSHAAICAALGKDIMGTAKVMDLTKMPHLLVAGSTGSGKSVCINGIIASILMRYKPSEVKLVLIDPKKVELTNYNGIPHLLCPVVSDPKKASLTLQRVVKEMDDRFQLFSDKEVKNIAGYNELIDKENKKHPEQMKHHMPYIVTIIDELADLMLVASKEVEDSITRITQLARAAGIHLIVATQRPSTDVITGLIKNNIPSRISFAVSSQIDSRTILDQSGAEKLLGRGDMLYFPMGESAPTRIQGCFINDEEIKRLIDYCKSQADASYNEEFVNINLTNTAAGSANSLSDEDEDYNAIVEFAIQHGQISASLIQRRFHYGFNRAANMMDLLEERGIVGPQNGSKPREVLVKLESNKNDEE